MNATRLKQIGFGILTAIAVLSVFELLPSFVPSSVHNYRVFGHFYFGLAIEAAIVMFIAASAGAYVARVNFIWPAILLAVAVWFLVVYILNSIAAAAGQGDLLGVASINVLSLLFGACGSAIGALVGSRFARKTTEENAVGAT
jgi:hypothetical protein